MKISSKILGAFILTAFVVFVALATSHFLRIRHHFEADFLRNAKVLAYALDGSITTMSDLDMGDKLRVTVQKTMWLNPDVVRIDINTPLAGKLSTVVSSEPSRIRRRAGATNAEAFKNNSQVVSFYEDERGRFLSLSSPIHSAKRQIGTFDILFILEVIDERIKESMIFYSTVTFCAIFISSILLYLFIRFSIINRLDQLRQAVGIYGREGVLPAVEVDTRDEIGDLARDISQMTKDHTETQERLRQGQRLEAVGRLTGGIAHDFNNILMVVQGNAELLAKKSNAPAKLLTPILQAAESGSDLIKRLLVFSRAQSLSTEDISLEKLVSRILDILSVSVGNDVDVELNCEEELWQVNVDYGQVENAVLNLAINARDAMPDGGKLTFDCRNITVPTSALPLELDLPHGEYVCLSVTDTGTGMNETVVENAFDPFFTTKEVDEGTGLGLSMVYGFAQQSGGYACISTTEGIGTTVYIYLPRAEVSEGQQHDQADTDGDKTVS